MGVCRLTLVTMLEYEVELLASGAILWDKFIFGRGIIYGAQVGFRVDVSVAN